MCLKDILSITVYVCVCVCVSVCVCAGDKIGGIVEPDKVITNGLSAYSQFLSKAFLNIVSVYHGIFVLLPD